MRLPDDLPHLIDKTLTDAKDPTNLLAICPGGMIRSEATLHG